AKSQRSYKFGFPQRRIALKCYLVCSKPKSRYMKELLSSPPLIVRNDAAAVQALFQANVVPSYGRFDIVLSHGSGRYVWDVAGKRYLDFGAGIAVSSLGHAHPAITEALVEQSGKLIHVSNFYYHEPQGRLAHALVGLIGPGKCFFCNSGGEAN